MADFWLIYQVAVEEKKAGNEWVAKNPQKLQPDVRIGFFSSNTTIGTYYILYYLSHFADKYFSNIQIHIFFFSNSMTIENINFASQVVTHYH